MATKPNRVQAKQVISYVNGVPTRRIQTFDYNSNFTIDSIYEMGNAGLVEDAVNLVETGITMTSSDWGSTDTEAMMFGIFELRNVRGNKTGVANTTATIFVSSFGAGGYWSAVATGDWLQVIRHNAHATTNSTEYVKVKKKTFVAGGTLADIITLSPTYLLSAPAATADYVSLVNKYTITQDTVDSNPAHIILPHRYNTTGTQIMHSVLIPRCYVDNLTYNFDVSGAAEVSYSGVAEEERLVLGSFREMHSTTGSFIGYSGGSLTFRVPLDSLAAVGTPYIVYADANLLTSTGTITRTAGAATVKAYFATGLGIDSTTDIVYYHSDLTPAGWKGLTNITNTIGKLTKGKITVDMQEGTGTVEALQRCTGVSVSVPLSRETIDELGQTRSIAKPLEGNLRQELTLSFNRNDLREYAKLLGNQEAFDAGSLTEILMSNLKSVKNINIVLKFYNHETTHDSTTLLRTMTFNDCNFIGDNATTPISGAGGLELTFSTQTISFVGSGLPPTYS